MADTANTSSDSGKYKIKVDRAKCIGAASCVGVAPSTFKLDEENKAIVVDENGDLSDNILLAAKSCPTQAIILFDKNGKQIYP
ncbi:hypothetical protein A2160_00470 [Candidatus Beckwithbacteria bacterium RBG_13_42_9]|uniref:Ferredoxin n=1 Tax=Candidatus Beckwithbacteria bacterium RBG_13_42_9 TaxID=1797457 RepID=A0A1F5E3R0_9BACT|nr:MAG: hypothetical protein A2160_00470 [Candidatus Beckwithbacteria bacterium RBG_13_42_9]